VSKRFLPGGILLRNQLVHRYEVQQKSQPSYSIKEGTYCCGGGGGLLTDDLIELRVKGALPRMEALKSVVDEYGVTHMAAICAICKSQFSKVFPYYNFSMDQIISLHQLVSNAIVLQPEGNASEGSDDESQVEAA